MEQYGRMYRLRFVRTVENEDGALCYRKVDEGKQRSEIPERWKQQFLEQCTEPVGGSVDWSEDQVA